MEQLDVLTEEQRVIYDIIFSHNSKFSIELDWCDETQLLPFLNSIEKELHDAQLSIKEQKLVLTLAERKWYITIDRQNEKNKIITS